MTNKETAIEVRNIAAVCTSGSAERHRLQDLADRLEAALEAEPLEAPTVLAVVEGWMPLDDMRNLRRLVHVRAAAGPSHVPVTVTITGRLPTEIGGSDPSFTGHFTTGEFIERIREKP